MFQSPHSQNCRKPENIFVGFVPEESAHGPDRRTTPSSVQPQQPIVPGCPATLFGLELIVTKQQKINEI